ncbi:MAG: hypothetical protein KatS3mg062_1052 [Tepidiforma sp.]|nr:MAG: hypothetical protein KatS3mg062_1052 [Tepidiforma sp.]
MEARALRARFERVRRVVVVAGVGAVILVPGAVALWMLLAGRA